MKLKPIFDKRIFWDVDFDNIDYDAHYKWVIERVFDRGDVEDIRQCRRYYEKSQIHNALVNARSLRLETIYLACAILENEPTDYTCYTKALLSKQHLSY